MTFTTGLNDEGRRLDRILRKLLSDWSLGEVYAALRKGTIRVDGKRAKPSSLIQSGQTIEIIKIQEKSESTALNVPCHARGQHAESPSRVEPPLALPPLDILYECADFLALNKPAGLSTHGAGGLAEQVLAYLAPTLPPSLSFTPGPLHRLDKPASGIVLFGKTLAGSRCISQLIREHRIRKYYLALLEGELTEPEEWRFSYSRDKQARITKMQKNNHGGERGEEGKEAISYMKPLRTLRLCGLLLTLAEIEITTGRTHQIRASAAAAGHPLAGDRKYGSTADIHYPASRFFLHAGHVLFPAGTLSPLGMDSELDIRCPAPFMDNTAAVE